MRVRGFLAETRRNGLIVNPIDGAKLDSLIAELYRIPQDVFDTARSTMGLARDQMSDVLSQED
ncbi:MAG: hypothetical protein K2Y71_20765 [Xanthobacteraceae bacterium]|nr:hypothetical protein [Xanthobacteraceae bacterium]